MTEARAPEVYTAWASGLTRTARQMLAAVDTENGIPQPWWKGNVRIAAAQSLGIGRCFTLTDGHPNAPSIIGQYRVVGLALAPEGYVTVVAYAAVAVASQVPTISFNDLVGTTGNPETTGQWVTSRDPR